MCSFQVCSKPWCGWSFKGWLRFLPDNQCTSVFQWWQHSHPSLFARQEILHLWNTRTLQPRNESRNNHPSNISVSCNITSCYPTKSCFSTSFPRNSQFFPSSRNWPSLPCTIARISSNIVAYIFIWFTFQQSSCTFLWYSFNVLSSKWFFTTAVSLISYQMWFQNNNHSGVQPWVAGPYVPLRIKCSFFKNCYTFELFLWANFLVMSFVFSGVWCSWEIDSWQKHALSFSINFKSAMSPENTTSTENLSSESDKHDKYQSECLWIH